jgi:hypothetical protein
MQAYFDWKYYINKYTDLKKNKIDTKHKAYLHWITHGMKENRTCNKIFEKINWKKYISDNNIKNINKDYILNHYYINFNKNTPIKETLKAPFSEKPNILNEYKDMIYSTYNMFDSIEFSFYKKYMYHYLVLIYKNENMEPIKLNIDNIENDMYIVIASYNKIYLFQKLQNINNINNSFDKELYIYIIKINNNNMLLTPITNNTMKIYNSNLFIRNINNNVNININNGNNISINNNYLEEDIDIDIKDDEKTQYIVDKCILNKISNCDDDFIINYKMMKGCSILILTHNDWSNTAYRFMKSLEKNNIYAILIKCIPHIFNYPKQGIILKEKIIKLETNPITINIPSNYEMILNIANNVKYIWFHASTIFYLNNIRLDNLVTDKKYIVTHGGSTYRDFPNKSNDIFNKIIDYTIIQCPDLLKLGANNEKLIYYPVDINFIKPEYNLKNNKLVFGHFPSTPEVKGTGTILEVIKSYNNKLIYIGTNNNIKTNSWESWEDHIKRYTKCDVYIETINLDIRGKKFGEWGNTCLEACASGCIVITNFLSQSIYIDTYNNTPPILIANNKSELIEHINKLLIMTNDEIIELKMKMREWVEQYHSLIACGKRIKDFINL